MTVTITVTVTVTVTVTGTDFQNTLTKIEASPWGWPNNNGVCSTAPVSPGLSKIVRNTREDLQISIQFVKIFSTLMKIKIVP